MKAHALGALGALLYVAGYPAGWGWWPLSCLALTPLLWSVTRHALSPGQALRIGALFSVITQLIGYVFLPETLLRFSRLPWAICMVAHLALCLAQSGGIALWLGALAWLQRRGQSALACAAPLWVLQELGWPNVFEAPLGAALHDVPVLVQSAELGGVALLSLLVASVNAVLVAFALGIAERRRATLSWAAAGLGVIGLVVAASSLRLASIEHAVSGARALRVGLVQASLGAEEKRRNPSAYAERYVQLSGSISEPLDLLIWPETALARPVATTVQHMRQAHPSLANVRAPLLTGAVTDDQLRIFNSALLFGASGEAVGRVDKQKLLPFAEALPFGERFPALYGLIRGAGHFTAGTSSPVLALGATRLAIFICYEDMLAEPVRQAMTSGDASLLVSISNDAWFGESRAAYTHFAVARLRAVELRRTLVRATNTGVTAVVDPTGELAASLPEHSAATLVAGAPVLSIATLYARAGNAVVLALVGAWLVIAWQLTTGPRRSRPAARS